MARLKRFTIIIVLLISLFGILDLFKPGYYSSHDGTGHVIRMDEFYRAFSDGEIPVRWSERLYFGYGYPFFNFNYPSIYYIGVPLMASGLTATDAMKIETGGFFIISGLLMFLYLKRKVDLPYAVLGSVLFMYAPYRMSNMYVRGSVAEAMAFIFPPLLLWGAESLNCKRNILLLSLAVGLMGISHNISALLLSAFFFGYLVILSLFHKSIWPLVKGSVAFLLGILMAAFFMVPALYEKKWTFLDLTLAKDYPDHFVYWWQLIKWGWGFGGSVKGPNDGMSFNLGYVPLGLTLISLRFIKKGPTMFFAVLMFFVSIFFMLEPSKIIWDHMPLLPFVQFPWRFTMLTVPAMAVLGSLGLSFYLKKYSSKAQVFIITILILLTLFFAKDQWNRNQTEFVKNIPGDALEGSTTWANEQATRWLVPQPNKIPVNKIENASYTIESWKTGEHMYKITGSGIITENTMYYPGWEVYVNNILTPINYSNGKINYPVIPGGHEIKTVFTETPLRKAADYISLITFILVLSGLLFSYVVPQIFSKH